MDKRKYPRIALQGMEADISDGRGFFTGTVHDISRFGLALDDISAKINSHAEFLTVIVNGKGGHFKLRVRPRWETVSGIQKIIGGHIDNSPIDWTGFVIRFEHDKDDIWGNA
jgi:hypothetical protein